MLLTRHEKRTAMSSESEQDARVQELADVITPRIAEAMREAAEELGRQDSPMQEWGTALGEAKSPADLRRVSQELGVSLRESETGAAFSARIEAVNRIVDSAVEEWRSQREMSAEEVRQIRDQALRIVATKTYQMFGIEIPPTDRRQDKRAGQLARTKRTDRGVCPFAIGLIPEVVAGASPPARQPYLPIRNGSSGLPQAGGRMLKKRVITLAAGIALAAGPTLPIRIITAMGESKVQA